MNPQVPTLSVYLDATNLDEPMYRKNILNVEDQSSVLDGSYIFGSAMILPFSETEESSPADTAKMDSTPLPL